MVRPGPYSLFFLLILIGGAIGLVEPRLFVTASPPDRTIPYFLIGGTFFSALKLYIPSFVEMFVGVGTLLNKPAMGEPNNPQPGTLARIGSPGNPEDGTLLARISTLNRSLARPRAGSQDH
jgi:hypothetical protein